MAACKKKVKQKCNPNSKKTVGRAKDPDHYYSLQPSWNFRMCDEKYWPISHKDAKSIFWTDIFPRLQKFETMTWKEILKDSKKFHHSINVNKLNKIAQDRLNELEIEAESIISLRIDGTKRIYGYIVNGTFYILWIDLNHGDNKTCVCLSRKKHT